MSALSRQNTLFVSEDWVRIYEAMENVDFRAYDFDNLVQALLKYLQNSYPEQFNDNVASSEFIARVEILAWLSQNLAFRTDLNTRENFLATAERRDSLIRLAQNIGYKVNRVRSANGLLKLKSIRTTQSIIDSNGVNLRNKTIIWNDPRDEDWFERFILVLNSAFVTRTQFGFPISSFNAGGKRVDQYVFDSAAPISGSYRFNATVNGLGMPFDIYNGRLDDKTGVVEELAPNPRNAFNIFYQLDGRGYNSSNSGFFLPFKQGNLSFQDEFFTNPEVLRTVDLPASNVNNDDFFVQQIGNSGEVVEDWTQVDTTFGEGVSFNTLSVSQGSIYELDTLVSDQVRVRFGDGSFGKIPVGQYRFWYRTANPTPAQIRPSAIKNQPITIPYVDGGDLYQLTMSYSLETTVSNGVATESNFDIRTRAGKAFYTQNRMVNAQDYHNFYLKDSTIKKVKTVNRTFAGQSRYSRLTDPTSLYQNVKHTAEDGRIYQEVTVSVKHYSADENVLPITSLINQTVKPILRKSDKVILYYNAYSEIIFTTEYAWLQTSVVGRDSRGNITYSGNPQIVGNNGAGNLKYIDTDAVIRFDGPTGPASAVDKVIENGDATDGVIIRDVVPTGSKVFSVLPAMRNKFTTDEEQLLKTKLEQHLDFALSWNQAKQTWDFISSENISKNTDFSLDNQGDTSGSAKDASWMVLFEFFPNNPTDKWTITDRGLSLMFESAREIDFVFANADHIIDPETGRAFYDTIKLLECNESRNSLRRRNLANLAIGTSEFAAYSFVGNGTDTCFRTQQIPLVPENTVVLVNDVFQAGNGIDYSIDPSQAGYRVCFSSPPPDGASILVYWSSRLRSVTQTVSQHVGDGVKDEFDLGVSNVQPTNIIAFIDGVIQNSSLDFGVSTQGTSNAIVFNEVLTAGTKATVYVMSGVDNPILTKSNYVGDGNTTAFTVPTTNQTSDTIFVSLDGITQAPSKYTVVTGATDTTITFTTAPPSGLRIRIISVTNPTHTKSNQYEFSANGVETSFVLANNSGLPATATGVIVTIDGIMQEGPWATTPQWAVTGGNTVLFNTAPPNGSVVQIFVISGSMGSLNEVPNALVASTNRIDVSSNVVNFFGSQVIFTPYDVIRHADGYVNKNGLAILPVDSDLDGVFDEPFVFKDMVIQDNHTDLVLWRKIQEFGFDVLDPINETTKPKGTYGNSAQSGISVGDSFDPTLVSVGDVHYDSFTKKWLIADGTTTKWIEAPDQSIYRVRVGRDRLKFVWTHYAPEANRIDPSKSNIMNVYVLTSGYNDAYRNWIDQGGVATDMPIPETSEQLRIQYADYEDFKPMSDAVIYYPARFKPLFGNQAAPELQAVFKVIQTKGSQMSESDLKLRILAVIKEYFNVSRWEFGEKFYFTELVAYVHSKLSPDLQSMVIVPRGNAEAFGRMFQVRAEPDELFISAAAPSDIEMVPFFTDEEIRIGSLV